MSKPFDPTCRACPRLATFLDEVRTRHPDYHARPVPAFGDPAPSLLIVGLAPGMHGANRSGRPFTGDYAGVLLYETLHRFGYASAPESLSVDDSLQLTGCRITTRATGSISGPAAAAPTAVICRSPVTTGGPIF
jgi:uracil-DNA glycosylase